MGPGVGLPFIAEGALSRGQIVMVGTAYPQVKPTTGANVKVIGYVLADAADGQEVAIHPVTNGAMVVKALASATISRGDPVYASAVTGRIASITNSTTLKYGCGIALEAGITAQIIDVLPSFFESSGS